MSFSDEKQKRLLEGYGETQEIEYLDEHLDDEVVPDLEFFFQVNLSMTRKSKTSWRVKMHISKA